MLNHIDTISLALTSRILTSEVQPLTAKDYWRLLRKVDIGGLPGMLAEDLSREIGLSRDSAERISRLVERGAAVALKIEELEHKGVWTIAGNSSAYPSALFDRLQDSAPPVLHGVGDQRLLYVDGIGVAGSRNAVSDAFQVAHEIAECSARRNLPIVTGNARGVDLEAMNAALANEGSAVGVLAESLLKTVAKQASRRSIFSGQLCLITPYAPNAPFSAGNAMGRNKIVYALSRHVYVVTADNGSGGTWAGATEALKKTLSSVISWTGEGSTTGNLALVSLGAHEVRNLDELRASVTSARPFNSSDQSVVRAGQPSLF